jgi:hypothetical protein
MKEIYMFKNQRLTLLLLLLCSITWGQKAQRIRVANSLIDEQSAIVKSGLYPDVYWVLNDSGDEARIFAIHENGETVIPSFLKKKYKDEEKTPYTGIGILNAQNSDWESLARIGDTLIIADLGNNGNARRDLGLYLLPEPNPNNIYFTRVLQWLPVEYEGRNAWPSQELEYDCEAVFTVNSTIYALTKHRKDGNINRPKHTTNLYKLDTHYTDKTNILKKIDNDDHLGGWVTGADVSPNGKRLAVLIHSVIKPSIRIYTLPKEGEKFLSSEPQIIKIKKGKQCEGIVWKDNSTLIITNEEQYLITIVVE